MVGALALGLWIVPALWIPVAAALLMLRQGLGMTVWLALLFVVVVACPILVFEGGLFVLPAAVALLVHDALGRRPGAPVSA